MKSKLSILLVLFICLSTFTYSQFTVEGVVKNPDGNPIENVYVRIKNSKSFGVYTDIDGKFKYENISSDTLTLVFESDFYQNFEENINYRTFLEVILNYEIIEIVDDDTEIEEEYTLVETGDGLDEVVVTSVSKKDKSLFGSVRSLSSKKNKRYCFAGYSDIPKSKESKATEYEYEKTESIDGIVVTEDYEYDADYENDIKSGMLTAGEIHDFSKWELWNDITEAQLSEYKDLWNIYPLNRFCVQLTSDDGKPLIYSKVELRNNQGDVLWETHTDNTGKAELWSGLFNKDENEEQGFYISINHNKTIFSIDNPKKIHEGVNFLSVQSECNIPNNVDIAFVVDATGSMSDEINYLKVELQDIIERAGKEHPELTINLGSVFYRDHGDSYLTIKSDLSSDISQTVKFIREQYAGGGGDFPEAVDDGLDVAVNQLTWSEKAIAKICFLVLDAPPHNNQEVKDRLQKITKSAAEKGIRIVPITCSGIDKSTEYLMRSMALATNGTYVFLTDDSGIGDSHIEPTTDEWEVEFLNDLIIRLIDQYVLTPTCDNKLPISEEEIQDTSYLVIDKIDPILDVNLINNDTTNNSLTDIEPIVNPIIDTTSTVSNPTEIDVPYDYSKGLKYYPNPTTGFVNIEMEGEIKELYLADNSGKLLEKYVFDDNESYLQLNLYSYPSGIYYIKYLNKDQWKGGQIILLRN